jgi:hypothetical protein
MYLSRPSTCFDTGILSWPPFVSGRSMIPCCQSIISHFRKMISLRRRPVSASRSSAHMLAMCRWPLRPFEVFRPLSITTWTRCRSSGVRKRSRFFIGKCSMPWAGLYPSSISSSLRIQVNRLLTVMSRLFALPGVSFKVPCSALISARLMLRQSRSPNCGTMICLMCRRYLSAVPDARRTSTCRRTKRSASSRSVTMWDRAGSDCSTGARLPAVGRVDVSSTLASAATPASITAARRRASSSDSVGPSRPIRSR